MIALLNIGSLVLGLIALIFPIINFMRYVKHDYKNWIAFSFISISACAISLCFQIFNSYLRVKSEDWSALMDIAGARASVAAVLLIVTIILNGMTLVVYRERTES